MSNIQVDKEIGNLRLDVEKGYGKTIASAIDQFIDTQKRTMAMVIVTES